MPSELLLAPSRRRQNRICTQSTATRSSKRNLLRRFGCCCREGGKRTRCGNAWWKAQESGVFTSTLLFSAFIRFMPDCWIWSANRNVSWTIPARLRLIRGLLTELQQNNQLRFSTRLRISRVSRRLLRSFIYELKQNVIFPRDFLKNC